MESKVIYRRVGNFFILIGVIAFILAYGPILYDEAWYWLKVKKHQELSLETVSGSVEDSVFARLLTNKPIRLKPVNTDFSIIIEKLGVNAPIKADVSVADSQAYFNALKEGVAHASVSDYPSEEPGNVYLFAHSAVDFWNFGRYAKVFNLLRKLEIGDKVHIFYEGRAYVYEVVNKETYDGWNTYPITRATIEPVLTLQTCDPPGTTLNRLVVTAVLKEVNESQ